MPKNETPMTLKKRWYISNVSEDEASPVNWRVEKSYRSTGARHV